MKKLFKITSLTALATLLKMVVGFIVAKVVAIYTGPTGLATLGQLQSFSVAITGVVNSPVGAGVVRYTAEYREHGYEQSSIWWKAASLWVLFFLLVCIPVCLIFSDFFSIFIFGDNKYSWVIKVIALSLPFSALGMMYNSILNGTENYKKFVSLGVASALISGFFMVILIYMNHIEGALLAASLQAGLIGLVIAFGCLRQSWNKISLLVGSVDREAFIKIGGYVLMALTTAITIPISHILIRNILVESVGWDQAGVWQATWKISEVYLGVITMALATYYLPTLAAKKSFKEIESEVKRTALYIMPVVSLLAFLVFISRDILISILFTDEFSSARELFATQLIGDVIKILAWLYAYPMISKGATKWYVGSEIVFSISFVLFTYLFVDNTGLIGVTYAYLLNYVLYFLFLAMNLKRLYK